MLYIVYRHGSNAANQSMCQTKPLCLVEAQTPQEARTIAEEYHLFYPNQYSQAILAWRREKDSNLVNDSIDNDLYRNSNNRRVFRHPQIIATVEPQLKF